MRAVARVRGVREQDSRLGLRRAIADEHEARGRVVALEATLRRPGVVAGDVATFLTARAAEGALAEEASRARQAAEAAGTVSATALAHWQQDRTRLAAVELLLERRAERRRAERARRETAEIDDLTAVRWQRARRGGEQS
jgi:hypothetical protein